ncbi:hypothetical protein DKX38_028896 [Salix brachista]|uniref:Uncharacterized protein n=1 Tax=Salix brachista TaxID=2182728 RepID=A0A5N5IXR1_9ROSI|nr:hypothetical protein DKX38_028896 [Salix brachista]
MFKYGNIRLPSYLRPSTTALAPGKPVGTIVEYFGWVGAVWQCFYSTVEYAYAHSPQRSMSAKEASNGDNITRQKISSREFHPPKIMLMA